MRTLLFLHLLGAAIWVGGHLVLALGILPGALRRRDPQAIRAFEQVYERIGIPALLLQVVSGLWLASLWLPFDHWFGATPVARAQPLGDFVLELHPLLLQPLQRQVVEGFATALDLVDALVEALIVRRQASEVGVVAMKLLQFGMKIRKLPGKRMLLERHDGPPLTLYTTPPD